MTLSERNEEKVRSALAALVDATPVGAEFDDLAATELAPAPRRRSGALAFGIAFLVVGLAGGLMLWVSGDLGSTDQPDPAASPDLTLAQWFEQTRANSIQVNDSPVVLQGLPGPEPEFDVTSLGEEQTVTTLTADMAIDWSILESVADQTPVISGFTPQTGYFGVVRFESETPMPGFTDGPHVCTFAHGGEIGEGLACANASPASDEMVDYGLAIASIENFDGNPDTLTVRTPPGASVVAINVADESYWQRPNGNMAAFIGAFTGQQVDIVIYDPQGNVLHAEEADL